MHLSIDDFGVGYSNLNELVNLPFDTLKIDRSLIDAVGKSRRSEIVIESIIQLAAKMGQRTVAEGIETDEQLEFLRNAGATHLQGYLLARPGPIADIQRFIPELNLLAVA